MAHLVPEAPSCFERESLPNPLTPLHDSDMLTWPFRDTLWAPLIKIWLCCSWIQLFISSSVKSQIESWDTFLIEYSRTILLQSCEAWHSHPSYSKLLSPADAAIGNLLVQFVILCLSYIPVAWALWFKLCVKVSLCVHLRTPQAHEVLWWPFNKDIFQT